MKALDTPALLAILEGTPPARELLRRLRGSELATTEANLLELTLVASAGPRNVRTARLNAVGRLRQRLTVLPVDGRAEAEIRRRASPELLASPAHVLAMLGALEAGGCDELYTEEPSKIPSQWRFKVSRIGSGKSQLRQKRK